MKRLSDEQIQERRALIERVRALQSQLEIAVNTFNEALAERWAEVESALGDYNEAVEAIDEYHQNVQAEIQDYIDDRSDAWREGERGQAYETWAAEWNEAAFYTVDIDCPDPIESPEMNHADDLESLPDAP